MTRKRTRITLILVRLLSKSNPLHQINMPFTTAQEDAHAMGWQILRVFCTPPASLGCSCSSLARMNEWWIAPVLTFILIRLSHQILCEIYTVKNRITTLISSTHSSLAVRSLLPSLSFSLLSLFLPFFSFSHIVFSY